MLFNTLFIEDREVFFSRADVDGCHKDLAFKKFDPDFHLRIDVRPSDRPLTKEVRRPRCPRGPGAGQGGPLLCVRARVWGALQLAPAARRSAPASCTPTSER